MKVLSSAQVTAGSHVVSALVGWVEQGAAPTTVTATKYAADGVTITRQRPACACSQIAAYRGSGDPDAAAGFQCVTPAANQLPTHATDLALIQNSLRQRDPLAPTG